MTTTEINPEQMLFTVPQVMQLLKLGRSTVYELIGRGELGSCKIGRSVRVSRRQYDDFVARLHAAPNAG